MDEVCSQLDKLWFHHFVCKAEAGTLHDLKDCLKNNECIVLLDFTENYSYIVQGAVHGVLLLANIKSKIISTASVTVCYQIILIITQMLFMFLLITCFRVWKFYYHKCIVLLLVYCIFSHQGIVYCHKCIVYCLIKVLFLLLLSYFWLPYCFFMGIRFSSSCTFIFYIVFSFSVFLLQMFVICGIYLTEKKDPETYPKTLKYWVGVQQGQSYLMGRRCLFSLGWPPF